MEQLHDYIDCQRKIFIISDDNVPECYQQTVSKQFPNSYLHIVKHGEGAKSFAVLEDCLTQMLRRNFSRKDLVIALGGGVIGDLAGFVAASYMRGIDFYKYTDHDIISDRLQHRWKGCNQFRWDQKLCRCILSARDGPH